MDLELQQKVVAITGGTDGLGLALAHRLVAEGAAVAICGRDAERLASAETGLKEAGGDVLALQADAAEAEDIERFIGGVIHRWHRLDGIVHNAGKSAASLVESSTDATWEADLQLKLMGAVRMARISIPHLRESKGSVLFTLALAAKSPGPGSTPSSVSRAAGMALTKALSKELAPDGIRVNAILIGLVESGQWVRMAESAGVELPDFYEKMARDSSIPLGRIGRADEFADLAAYLLSARASYVTGTAINLDGGMSPVV
jgi:NAD(P)-dependent dehydrogenase (short-subunit alcohol dehydrogenase family)